MIRRRGQQGLAAVALWAAAAAMPRSARGDFLSDASRDVVALEQRVGLAEAETGLRGEEALKRAQRRFSEGEIQFLLQDWVHCAVLLYDAVDVPEFRASRDYPAALWYIAESLYQQGSYLSAAPYLKRLLAMKGSPHEGEAVLRSLDVAVRLGNYAGVDELVARAREIYAGRPPPEVLYLAAKALYRRQDLRPAERRERAQAALAVVPPPYDLAAAYLAGALDVEAGDLAAAARRFEGCTRLEAGGARRREVRELCFLALGRVYGELGRISESLDRYQEIPRESPHFDEALFEVAWTYVKAKRYEQALRTAALIADLSPESPLAPEAAILEGHLYLRLGRYDEALETYNRVVNQYAPVRDEIDALLSMREDPVRYFNELIGRSDKAFDVASVLPPVAVKWASTQRQVAAALAVVGDLDHARRDLASGEEIADRIDAVISRAGGLDAFPLLKDGYARAEAVQNAAAKLDGRALAEETDLLRPEMPESARAEVERLRGERAPLEARVRALPGTPEEVEARQQRIQERFAGVDRAAFQLGYVIDSISAAIAGTQAWLDEHRGEVAGSPENRAELMEEMRKHREVAAAYGEELRTLRRQIAKMADAATGTGLLAGDDALRAEYRAALQKERAIQGLARRQPAGDALDRAARLRSLRERLAAVDARAERMKGKLSGTARAGSEELHGRLEIERRIMRLFQGELSAVQDDTRDLVGRVAYRSFREVRAEFYRLVLKADVGIIDVAWQRKHERVEKIQRLAAQKAADLEALDGDYQGVLREVQ